MVLVLTDGGTCLVELEQDAGWVLHLPGSRQRPVATNVRGWRVCYRRVVNRTWRSFMLAGVEAEPNAAMLTAAIEEHEGVA